MIDLSPHDLAHDGDGLPNHTITEATWLGETWQIGLSGTLGPANLRAVCYQKPGTPLLYMAHAASKGPNTPIRNMRGILGSLDSDPFGLRMSFSDVMAKGKWARGFFLTEDLQLRQRGETARHFLLLSPHGWGEWHDCQVASLTASYYRYIRQAAFYWSQNDESSWLYETSVGQIIERVQSLHNEPNSDAALALMVSGYSRTQTRRILWPCHHGDMDEFERVLRCAFLADEELWQMSEKAHWNIGLSDADRPNSYIETTEDEIECPSLDKALTRAFAFYQPTFSQELADRHICLQDAKWNLSWLNIEAEAPTAHEQLEASLEWRNWLAAHPEN